MQIPEKRIEYKYGDIIKIKPLFDLHLGDTACDERAIKDYIDDRDENTYFFGGGDTLASIVVPDKRYRKSSDSSTGDAIVDHQIEKAEKLLLPIKDRLFGLACGNHEDTITIRCGTNPIERLCRRLGVDMFGYSGLMKLVLHEKSARGRTVYIRYHHGWGGGSRTQGADLTKFSKDMIYWNADIFLYGHVHRKQSDRVPRMGMVGKTLVAKPMLLGICGSYQKTYTIGNDPTWAETKGFPPGEIGGITVNIRPTNKWVDYWIDV